MTTTAIDQSTTTLRVYGDTGYVYDSEDPTTWVIYEYTRKDKYGRTVRHFEQGCRTLLVMVTIPRKGGWIVNDWEGSRNADLAGAPYDPRRGVHMFKTADGATRREAYAKATALVAALRPGVKIVRY